ncbi:MAG: TlyA family RNA methyltransferase [Acidobacteria bacterium]|nr:TlyA family RNA methyltransferase [Acidobacteriota bacterium]
MKTRATKVRLDKLLVERGLAASRERAHALVLAGKVLVNEQKVVKAGAAVAPNALLRLLDKDLKYVSRGGLKLEAALQHWKIEVRQRACLDVGASTGGFTDCLLQSGAGRVIAVDTGYGQMDSGLRSDPRVRLLERTNARYLKSGQLAEPVSLIAMDVSFISATLVLPAVVEAAFGRSAAEKGRASQAVWPLELVVLVKPQFEAGRAQVGKGGIVREAVVQAEAVERVRRKVVELGARNTDSIESPIQGAEGNREFLLYAIW